MKRLSVLPVAVLVAAAPALAQQHAKPAEGQKLICRDLGSTGSRAKSNRVCKTKEQWDQLRGDSQKTADDWRDAIRSDKAANPR